ncbi:hypothetical protein EON78_06225, partial [bacterium]
MINKSFQGLLYPNNSADSVPVNIFVESNNLKLEYSGNFIFSMINPDNASSIGLYSYNSVTSKMEALSGYNMS